MNLITSKLSSKNQITVPKTVRDFLGVSENDSIQFFIEEGRVYLEKGRDIHICPFCRGEDFYGYPCEFCNGEGLVESLTKGDLTQKLYDIFISKGIILKLDAKEPLIRLQIESEDELLKRYREHFQMEYIKAELKHYKIKDLLDKDLQEQMTDLMEFEASKQTFTRWWDSLVDRHI